MKNTKSYESYIKSPFQSIKHSPYFEIYDELFSRYREKEITFVEIEVLGGGSLFMWRDFFGPKAKIIGIDLNPNAKKWEAHGFPIYIGSQSDKNFWKKFISEVGMVDVVLDDGGHTYDQQIITAEMMLSNIKNFGMLVVEDTHTSYMDGYGRRRYSFIQYVNKFIDKNNHRFNGLDNKLSDTRVWSIQSFQSIVAFHVNREASFAPSEPTTNNGENDLAIDYRYHDQSSVLLFNKISHRLSFLKKIPGFPLLAEKVRILIIFISTYIKSSKF